MTPYYADDSVTLYHGDCREIDEWQTADVLVTDPPYGIQHSSSFDRRLGRVGKDIKGRASWHGTTIAGDEDAASRDDVLTGWGCRPALVFGSWKTPRPAAARAVLVWDKGPAAGMGDLSIPWKPNWEEIYILGSGFVGKRDSGVLRHNVVSWESAGRSHPHEKPLSLMRYLVSKCPAGVIADPFAGSGTTLRAAKDLGRKAIGVEVEERYCEVIARRLAQDVLPLGAA